VRPVTIGGLVAVGFVDEQRVIVGSLSGLGIIDARSGTTVARISDVAGSYEWFSETPPSATWPDLEVVHTVPVAGLWGGSLLDSTADGWRCSRSATGAVLRGPRESTLDIADAEEFRAFGFSPGGSVFVYASSATLSLVSR
jgi:hypothetical protein